MVQAIAAHARGNPETDPIRRVHGAVSSVAPHLADLAAHHAARALNAQKVFGGKSDNRSSAAAGSASNASGGGPGNASLVKVHASILKNARRAFDGHHYVPDPNRPGKYARVMQQSGASAATNSNMRDVDLIRHGETDMNESAGGRSIDLIRGHHDVPLNAAGKQQSVMAGEQIAKGPHRPDVLVSSDLCRAKLTAQIISEKTGIPISWITEHFRPWDAGQLTGKPSKTAVPIMGQYAEHRPDEPLPGGESFHTFLGRLFIGIDEALRRHQGKRIGIVSHHRDERVLHSWRAKGFPLDGSIDIKTFNQKGENTGTSQSFQIPADRVRVVAQRYRNAAMAPTPDRPQDERPGQE
jgi:2,3-bisphosphoglycerate-dependent phosphoglycerate mutase